MTSSEGSKPKQKKGLISERLPLVMQEISEHDVLSVEEERLIAAKVSLGDEKAKQELFSANLRLVVYVASKYMHCGLSLEDLFQEGSMGLVKAIERFDHKKGYKFSTYAFYWIKSYVTRSIETQGRMIRLPSEIQTEIRKLKNVQESLKNELDREPTDKEMVEEMGITRIEYSELLQLTKGVLELDAPLSSDDDEGTLEDLVVDKKAITEKLALQDDLKDQIEKVLNDLTEKEAMVIRLRFGIGSGIKPCSIEETRQKMNLSKEKVRLLESKALRKLRLPEHKELLKEYKA